MFEDSSPQKNAHAVNIHVFFFVHQLRVLLALSFVSLPYLMISVWICIFHMAEIIYEMLEDCICLYNFH